MKIIHVCLACFYIENMEYQENVLPRKHKEMGHEVYIIASRYTFDNNKHIYLRDAGSYSNKDGIPVTILDYSKPSLLSRYLQCYKGLYDKIYSIKPDIIFIHGCQFYGIKEIIKYKKRNPNVRLLADNHADYINTPIKGFKYFLLNKVIWAHCVKKTIPFIEKYWGVTPLRVDYLMNVYKIPENKVDLLIMGGDESFIHTEQKSAIRKEFCESLSIPQDSFVIVTGGKIDKKKNIHLLIREFEKVHITNQYLVIFGSIPNDLKPLLETNDKNIIFVGWKNPKEIYNMFVSFDLGFFPGTHSVLWEQACASGLPCVFNKYDGMEHVNFNGNCLLINGDSCEELNKALKTIINNDGYIYNEMKKNAILASPHFQYHYIAIKSIE